MKTVKIKVITNCNHEIHFTATEVKSNSGYGRDLYVAIEKVGKEDTELFQHCDVRYEVGYQFESFVEKFFKSWYGSNLATLEVEVAEAE